MKSRVLAGFVKPRSNTVNAPIGNVVAFLNELAGIAAPDEQFHFRFKKEDGHTRGFVQLICSDRLVQIHRLWTLNPGNGCGSIMMQSLCDLADRHGVEMKLKVIPIGRKPYPLSREQLKAWYERWGFSGPKWVLLRKPVVAAI